MRGCGIRFGSISSLKTETLSQITRLLIRKISFNKTKTKKKPQQTAKSSTDKKNILRMHSEAMQEQQLQTLHDTVQRSVPSLYNTI